MRGDGEGLFWATFLFIILFYAVLLGCLVAGVVLAYRNWG